MMPPMMAPSPALLPAWRVRPAHSSPMIAPIIGPRTSHNNGGGRKKPIKAPSKAPTAPFHEAPNFRAPHTLIKKSVAWATSVMRPVMMTTFQPTEASPSQSLWMMTPDHTIKLPGTTGSSELASPSRKIKLEILSAVYSIQVIVQYDAETLSDWKSEKVVY